jgi:hypothetical protein
MEFIEAQESLRPFWKFQFPAGEVAKGAEGQRDFRKSRQEWWTTKKAEVMEAIKKDGIEITESLADQLVTGGLRAQAMSNYQGTTAIGPQVTIRQDLLRQLQECHQKIDHHRRAVDEYDGWVQFLGRDGDRNRTLELTQADWLYFFGKR